MSDHYAKMKLQPYDVMRANGVLKDYLWSAAVKYLLRAGKKKEVPAEEDLCKAGDCISELIRELEKEEEVPF